METQTLASRNVVDLLLQDEFNSGICRESMPPSSEEDLQKILLATSNSSKPTEDFVYGFDC
jgi:prenylcysteine oxidase/farnesylcysteine lyase